MAAHRAIRLVQPGLVQLCCVRAAVHVAEVGGKHDEVFRAGAASVDALEAQDRPARGCQFGEAQPTLKPHQVRVTLSATQCEHDGVP